MLKAHPDKGGSEQWTNWMEEVMRECLRVLKPGAHALVWALPRTSHWTAWAIERAGFEAPATAPTRKRSVRAILLKGPTK
jgi:DNA modification methylase